MPNLVIKKSVDEDLKVVTSYDENTSLSLAKEGNGVRIDGDLDVTGSYKGPLTVDGGVIKSDNDITLDAGGDVSITGQDVNIDATKKLFLDGGNGLKDKFK